MRGHKACREENTEFKMCRYSKMGLQQTDESVPGGKGTCPFEIELA